MKLTEKKLREKIKNLRLVISDLQAQKKFFRDAWMGSKDILARERKRFRIMDGIWQRVRQDIARMERR